MSARVFASARFRYGFAQRVDLGFHTSQLALSSDLEAPATGMLLLRTQSAESENQLFLCSQRANIRNQGVNLIRAERILEGRHSALAVGNCLSEFRIR